MKTFVLALTAILSLSAAAQGSSAIDAATPSRIMPKKKSAKPAKQTTKVTTASAPTGKTALGGGPGANPNGAKLSTDMAFDNLSVHGRYQAGDEGYATVEDEKALNDLLDYRKDYKDRLKNSRLQR